MFIVLQIIYVTAIIVASLLLLRVGITLLNLDPYHPAVQAVFKITEPIVSPFRFGIFKRPSKVDLAVIPPILILALLITYMLLALSGV